MHQEFNIVQREPTHNGFRVILLQNIIDNANTQTHMPFIKRSNLMTKLFFSCYFKSNVLMHVHF